MADYELLLQSPTAVPLGPVRGLHRCQYARGNNVGGEMTLLIPPDAYDPLLYQPLGRLLVQRTVGGGQPYIDLDTPWLIVDGPTPTLTDEGLAMVEFQCQDALGWILSGRAIPYNDYNVYTQKVAAADNLLKAFVRENAGTLATDTARSLADWMNVADDVGAAPSQAVDGVAYRMLLDVLIEIVNASANDATTPTWLGFDVALADQLSGLLEFRTYTSQRGVDHRHPGGNPPIVLSPERGNLGNVKTGWVLRDGATAIYAAGAGVGSIRATATASDAALIAMSPFGRREKVVDGSQIVDPAALQALAYAELRANKPRKYMTARLVETETCLRGVHFDYGDYLTAQYEADTYDVRLDKIAVTLQAGPGGGLVETTEVLLRGEQVAVGT